MILRFFEHPVHTKNVKSIGRLHISVGVLDYVFIKFWLKSTCYLKNIIKL